MFGLVWNFFKRSEPMPISNILTSRPAGAVKVMERVKIQKANGEKTMGIWLEHDPVALTLLVVGLAAVEFLAFVI